VVVENYLYPPIGQLPGGASRSILFLATYGHFNRADDNLCSALAEHGYQVYGLDPLRYLLHARARDRLGLTDLAADIQALCATIPEHPLVIGQPVSAGLALLWASVMDSISGAIAVGRAQLAFQPGHIFKNYNPHTFFLPRLVTTITPRPVAFVLLEDHPLGGSMEEISSLYESAGEPRRLEKTRQLDAQLLADLVEWLAQYGAP
jgi:hypothetical protein